MRFLALRRTLPLVLAAAIAGCTGAPANPPPVDQVAIGAAIDAAIHTYQEAVAARDTNAMMSLYAEGAQVLPPNQPRAEGMEAIRQNWVGLFSMPGVELSTASTDKLISDAGDMVVELGTYTFTGPDPSGKPMTDTGKYVTVYRQVSGEWKIVVETWNSDLAPPGT